MLSAQEGIGSDGEKVIVALDMVKDFLEEPIVDWSHKFAQFESFFQ